MQSSITYFCKSGETTLISRVVSRECVVLRYTKRVKRHFGGNVLLFPSVDDTIGSLVVNDFVPC